jgi:hypothetical protein
MTVHWCRPHELGTLDGSVAKVVETVRSTAGADDAGNISANGVAFIAKACKAHVCPLDAFNASVMAAMHALNDRDRGPAASNSSEVVISLVRAAAGKAALAAALQAARAAAAVTEHAASLTHQQ